jgi:hypothetical protein
MVALIRQPATAKAVSRLPAAREDSFASISADLVEACERIAARPELMETFAEELLRLDAIAQRLSNAVQANRC